MNRVLCFRSKQQHEEGGAEEEEQYMRSKPFEQGVGCWIGYQGSSGHQGYKSGPRTAMTDEGGGLWGMNE